MPASKNGPLRNEGTHQLYERQQTKHINRSWLVGLTLLLWAKPTTAVGRSFIMMSLQHRLPSCSSFETDAHICCMKHLKQRTPLTTLLFLGSRDWKCLAICRMASRRSTSSSVCLMFLALPPSSSSSPPPHNKDTKDRDRRRWRLFSCCKQNQDSLLRCLRKHSYLFYPNHRKKSNLLLISWWQLPTHPLMFFCCCCCYQAESFITLCVLLQPYKIHSLNWHKMKMENILEDKILPWWSHNPIFFSGDKSLYRDPRPYLASCFAHSRSFRIAGLEKKKNAAENSILLMCCSVLSAVFLCFPSCWLSNVFCFFCRLLHTVNYICGLVVCWLLV